MVLGLPSLRVGNRAGGPHSVQVPRLLQGRKTTEESKRIFLFTRFTGQMLLLLCLLAGTVQVGQAQSTATLQGTVSDDALACEGSVRALVFPLRLRGHEW
jgi:hypothetical protein